MAANVSRRSHNPLVRVALIVVSVMFLSCILIVPVISVLGYAFSQGLDVYLEALRSPDTLAAIRLTLTTAAIVVPVNTMFGVAAAWAIAKFDFRGKQILITLIDLPFSVSPVIAGLVFVLLFGAQGWFGPFLPRPRTFRSFTRCRASCSRRCWSRFRTSRAS